MNELHFWRDVGNKLLTDSQLDVRMDGCDRTIRQILAKPPIEEQDEKYQALQEIGKSAAESIAEMVAALECDYDRLQELHDKDSDGKLENDSAEYEEFKALSEAAGDCESREDAMERIMEDPLSVQVRNGWHDPGAESEPEEFEILLSTGGPATRIIGELNEHCEPTRARLQVQGWFTQWTDWGDAISQNDLLTYCRCFYFGE